MDTDNQIWNTFGDTVVHPFVLGFTLFMSVLIIVLPRRMVIVPLMLVAVIIPIQQRFVFATLDFFMLRILIFFGWARLLIRSEFHTIRLNAIDFAIILWAIARVISYSINWKTPEAFVNRLGYSFDALGIYFLFRYLIKNFKDIERIIKTLVFISALVASFMIIERATGRNSFSVLGDVPEFTVIRDGRMRCQGAFLHPILAGTFGAVLFPLFITLWWQDINNRRLAIVGSLAATVITVSASSSGPILAYLVGMSVLLIWSVRQLLPLICWCFSCMILIIQIIMDAPIWALLWRIKVFGASTGYHRFLLFDQFIKHFREWWLFGTKSTLHWGYRLFDITNQYVRIGIDGGLVTLLLFITIIVLCFTALAKAFQKFENQLPMQILLWGLGTSLLVNLVSFMGVSYFDQIVVIWYMLLAIISQVSNMINNNALIISDSDELIYEN